MSLVCVDEHKLLRDIERLLGRKIHSDTLPGYEPDPSIAAEPIQNGRNKGGQGQGQRRSSRSRPDGQGANRKQASRKRGPQSQGQARGGQAPEGSHARPQRNSNPNRQASRGEVDGNRRHSEVDGNRAGPQREVDGNRAHPQREVDGNRARPQREANGNRPRKSGGGKGGNNDRNPRQGRREKPALLGG
jgi:ATP-dependent RNA helicase RhlE